MKKIFLQIIAMSAIAVTANAQIEMGTQASYLTGHGRNDNHTALVGAVIYSKYALTDIISVGAAVHTYNPQKTQYYDGSVSYMATDNVTNISTTYDLKIGKKGSPIQPFLGADLGVSISQHNIEYLNDNNKTQKFNIKETYVMISPKMGVNIALGNSFGIFSQVQYNYSPGDGNRKKITINNAKKAFVLNTEPISKYINIDAGVYLQMGN